MACRYSSWLGVAVALSGCLAGCTKFEWAQQTDYTIQSNHKIEELDSYNTPHGALPVAEVEPSYSYAPAIVLNEKAGDAEDTLSDATKLDAPIDTLSATTELNDAEDTLSDATELDAPIDTRSATTELDDAETASCIDLNRADEKALMQLPGIGARRANDIIAMRNRKPFKRKRDITKVKGIGKKTFEKMEPQICDF